MAGVKLDARQIISRDILDHLVNAVGTELDDILSQINEEIKAPFRMTATSTPDLVLNIGAIELTNSDTTRRRTTQPINNILPTFASGTVTLPASSGNDITVSAGNPVALIISDDSFIKALIQIDENGEIVITLGTEAASEAAALIPEEENSVRSIGYIVIETVGSVVQVLNENRIVSFVGGGGGGGGGGLLAINRDLQIPSAAASTVTFAKTFAFGSDFVCIYRNGTLMKDVSPSSPADTLEYSVVDNGTQSVTINLATGFEADGTDEFDLKFMLNTFTGLDLAQKTIRTAHVLGDNSEQLNCTLAQVGGESQVTISGFEYVVGLNSGGAQGDLRVYVNGQRIERRVSGTNDLNQTILFDEVLGGLQVNIYEWDGVSVKSEIADDVPIQIVRETYFVSDLGAVTTNVSPEADDTFDLGEASKRWRDIYLGPTTLHMGTSPTLEGQMRWDTVTQKLQFRHLPTDDFADIGSGGGGSGGSLELLLEEEEAGSIPTQIPNQILDDFNATGLGTSENFSEVGSALRMNAGETSANVTYSQRVSSTINSMEGRARLSLPAYAPIAEAIVDATGLIKFTGDITNVFSTSIKLLIVEQFETQGFTRYQAVGEDKGFEFTITNVTFNSGTCRTSS